MCDGPSNTTAALPNFSNLTEAARLGCALTLTRTFNNAPFVFREDGWFNMTKAAKHFGKRMDNFWSSNATYEYISQLNDPEQPCNSRVAVDEVEVDEPWRQSRDKHVKAVRGQGTWAHPKLAVFFARWLDVEAKQAPALPRIDMHAGKSLGGINTLGQLSTGYSHRHGV